MTSTASKLPQPGLPQGSGPDWLRSPRAHDKRASHRGGGGGGCCGCFYAAIQTRCLRQHPWRTTCAREPSTTKNSSSSRAPKTGAQLRDNPEEREKWPKKADNHSSPPYPAESKRSLKAGRSTDCGAFRRPAQQGHRPPCESSATAGPPQFSALSTQAPVVVQQTGVKNLVCPRTAAVGSHRSSAQ